MALVVACCEEYDPMSDDAEYEALKAQGVSAEEIYSYAKKAGMDSMKRFVLIRRVFGYSFAETCEVVSRASTPPEQSTPSPSTQDYVDVLKRFGL